MSELLILGYASLKVIPKSINPDINSIIPRLVFQTDISHIPVAGQPGYTLNLTIRKAEFTLLTKQRGHLYVGMLNPDQPQIQLSPSGTFTFNLFLDLDYYRLTQIEKLREGGDLQGSIHLSLSIERQQPPLIDFRVFSFSVRIPKSDWVEKIMPQLKFKEVFLIEIPKIENPQFSDVIVKLNEAWKQYSMGEYDKVLSECRKALEGLLRVVKNQGYQKESENKKQIVDWERIVGNKDSGEIIGVLVQKIIGFTTPGSHFGKSINREDAELALLNTHALINFITKKLKFD